VSPKFNSTSTNPFQSNTLLEDAEVAARFASGERRRMTDLDPSLPRAAVVAELRERCRSMAPFDVALGRRAARVARGERPVDLGAVAPLRDKRRLDQGYYQRLADAANPDGDHERFYDPPDGADK